MTPQINKLIEIEILSRFTSAENKHNIEIPPEDKAFLIYTTAKQLDTAVNKFINGSIQHHDSPFCDMSPDQMITCLLEELIDAPNYAHGYFYVKAARTATVK